MCLHTQTFYMTSKLPYFNANLRRKITEGSIQVHGDLFPHCVLEILCVDDWLSSTRTDIQAGASLSLRFNKTHHMVPH